MINLNNLLLVLTFVGAIGSGLIAGLFCAFSNFMMKALASLPPDKGIAAMQAINIAIINPSFLAVFLGTATACLVVMALSLLNWHALDNIYLLVGSLLYLIGGVLVTIVFNVPRNDALAAVDPISSDGISLWRDYLVSWTNWNHVRAIATLAAAASLTIALRQLRMLVP
jgi:uncharacterized membrane protein